MLWTIAKDGEGYVFGISLIEFLENKYLIRFAVNQVFNMF